MTATNAHGTSAPSGASNAVTPAVVVTNPGAPTIGTATAGDASATVTWTPPASNGGSPITGYTVTSSPGGITASVGSGATSATVTGLTNGTTYTFTVTATNAHGTGAPSGDSNAVTPSSNTATISVTGIEAVAAGKKVKLSVTTGGTTPAAVSVTGLPGWLQLVTGTGRKLGTATISGTAPTSGGVVNFTVHANNGVGPDTTQDVTVQVLAISSPPAVSFTKGAASSFTVTTAGEFEGGAALTASVGTHLAGLTFHDNGNGTATLSGTPAAKDKSATLTVTASAGSIKVKQKLVITIS